ncbi:MAG: MCE family protein [Solirubrobacteraceae bacterium]|nr:MCE family protein [Solirubrobacteraceae bacterium]
MTAAMARVSVVTMAVALVLSVIVIVVTSRQDVGGTEVRAEFRDGWPLTEGMSVRMSGAVVGEVKRLELSDRGTAIAIMDVHDGLAPLRADATAAVRQQDLLGDSYVALTSGASSALLTRTIPVARTVARPRFDDVLDTLQPDVRDGIQVLLLELSRALDARGVDLNEAILRLRPGVEAGESIVSELAAQTAGLDQAVVDAQRVTSQIASNTDRLDGAVTGLAVTSRAIADASPALRDLLRDGPATMTRARGSLRETRALLRSVAPVSAELRDGAASLQALASSVRAMPADLRPQLRNLTTLTGAATATLKAGSPVFSRLGATDFSLLTTSTQGTDFFRIISDDLSRALIGNPEGERGLLSTTLTDERSSSNPKSDPARTALPMIVVPTCELFGRPVEPGCLTGTVSTLKRLDPSSARRGSSAASKASADSEAAVIDYLLGP